MFLRQQNAQLSPLLPLWFGWRLSPKGNLRKAMVQNESPLLRKKHTQGNAANATDAVCPQEHPQNSIFTKGWVLGMWDTFWCMSMHRLLHRLSFEADVA